MCPFFQSSLPDMPSTAKLLKSTYCFSNFKDCARYVVTQEVGADYVTDFLYPNNAKAAEEVIQKVKKSSS
ncbi:hypothetical protein GZ77_15995 [Endozoicomonas montiporae]|uniref:Uncharacterized protein n=1 Tax=Endozoicomonas montiporae TaxID=1027273 RepID=A0A081N5R1_9GAMM|nr:hypothetical protein GZ77_15995 [Endozoicomonas montiporae]